jgi:hypothetical protein
VISRAGRRGYNTGNTAASIAMGVANSIASHAGVLELEGMVQDDRE